MKNKILATPIILVLLISVFSIAVSIPPISASPAEIHVPGDYSTIQYAVNNASSGDTIIVDGGTHIEDVTIPRGLTLTAASGAKIVGGIWIKDIHTFTNSITVENFIIENGTDIDAAHDYGIKISGNIGPGADQAIVDMYIVNNTFINCGKTDDVTAEMWWNAAVFFDANYFGALGNRYDTIFTGTGEISNNTIINNLGDPTKRTQLGIGVRSGRNMKINYNTISGNVAEGIHHWGPVNTLNIGNYQIDHNYIDLSGWIGDRIGNNPRGIWSYAPQSSLSYNTVISTWIGMLCTYWDDTYWGGGTAGPNLALTVSHNVIHPPAGGNMSVCLRISGSDSQITDNEIYGATNNVTGYGVGLLFEGWGQPQWGERTECSNNTFARNYIHDNIDGIWTWGPPYNNTFNNDFHYNNIENNTNSGMTNNNVGEVVDARFNWWGNASGPTHSSNTGGTGDTISDNVDYSPWLGATFETTPRTYHVNPSGAPGAIQEAVDEASSGDTIIVHAGTYAGAIVAKKVTISACARAHGAAIASASIITSGVPYKWGSALSTAFRLDAGAAGAKILNFAINCNSSENFYFAVFSRNADNVTVDSLAISDAVQGITNWGGSNWQITNNVLNDTEAAGGGGIAIFLGVYPPSYTVCSGNLIQNNTITATATAPDYTCPGIGLGVDLRWGAYDYLTGNEDMSNNRILNNSITAPGALNGVGIEMGVIGLKGNTTRIAATLGIIHDNLISDNTIEGADMGIYFYTVTNLTIQQNEIKNCNEGIHIKDGSDDNTIKYNNILGNTIGLNMTARAQVYSNTIEGGRAGIWLGPGPYSISTTIKENTIIDFVKAGIVSRGAKDIFIEGNTISTTIHDEAPNGIDIGIYTGTNGTVRENEISGCSWKDFTGDYDTSWSGSGILVIESGDSLEITRNTVYDCDVGIDIESDSMNITCNDVHSNIYGFVFWNANPVVHHNNIYNNTVYGVYRTPLGDLTGTLDAEYNWWGNATGPYHNVTNPSGTGDRVSDGVDYDPWLDGPIPGDVAVINITLSQTMACKGQIVDIDVVVKNEGNLNITFDVTVYYDNIAIGTKTVTNLASGANITLTFSWNTTGVTPCINYTISAEASILPCEVDTADNIFVDGKVKINIMGDINGDGIVDGRDLGVPARAFGSYPGHPRWDPRADLNGDDFVDGRDLGMVGRNFGKTHP